jgi:amino acid transporter
MMEPAKAHVEPSSAPAPQPGQATTERNPRVGRRIKEIVLGKPRRLDDPQVFHNVSLIAFLAWVGLGADGLSSSAYGPDEAFRALGEHTHLAVALAAATAFTVFIISYAYSRIIEHFPFGGGGYVVATKLLGKRFGVVSGAALLVDYVLTITVSIAGGADALWSFLPLSMAHAKLPAEFAVICLLVVMNLRGVRESVTILAPIFLLFILTHAILLICAIGGHVTELPAVAHEVHTGFQHGLLTLGFAGTVALFFRAYSLGGGTYTGIEAVSNGLAIMREPRVETAKRTMVYMATSLALTAGGILLAYLLVHASPEEGRTMNAVLLDRVAGGWTFFGFGVGPTFVIVSLVAEGALLFVAAQTGFIDGPRVMANMATDSWLPHRFSSLSERLTMQEGVLLIGAAALGTLFYTQGDITMLVTMYSINVFLTFSLSEMGMCRFWVRERATHPDWKRHIPIHIIGLILCLSILTITVYEKAAQGGWVTLVVTACAS